LPAATSGAIHETMDPVEDAERRVEQAKMQK
jgi:hypothetical protein